MNPDTLKALFDWFDDGGRIYFLIPIMATLALYLMFMWGTMRERTFPHK